MHKADQKCLHACSHPFVKLEQQIQIWAKLIVYKVAMQCNNMKTTSTTHTIFAKW